jgi:hypothetical protein
VHSILSLFSSLFTLRGEPSELPLTRLGCPVVVARPVCSAAHSCRHFFAS